MAGVWFPAHMLGGSQIPVTPDYHHLLASVAVGTWTHTHMNAHTYTHAHTTLNKSFIKIRFGGWERLERVGRDFMGKAEGSTAGRKLGITVSKGERWNPLYLLPVCFEKWWGAFTDVEEDYGQSQAHTPHYYFLLLICPAHCRLMNYWTPTCLVCIGAGRQSGS